jgi:hypothetical protein
VRTVIATAKKIGLELEAEENGDLRVKVMATVPAGVAFHPFRDALSITCRDGLVELSVESRWHHG